MMFMAVLNASSSVSHVQCPTLLRPPTEMATIQKGVSHEEESVPSGPIS